MSLWIPPGAVDDARRDQAEVMAQAMSAELEHWTRECKQIDEGLEVVWYGPEADIVGVIPERYHVLHIRPGRPVNIIPIVGPEDEYRPLDSSLFDRLRASDLWDDRVQRVRRKAQEELTRAQAREKAREREERREELRDRVNAAFRTSVSMNTAAPWSQNAKGRKGAGRKKA